MRTPVARTAARNDSHGAPTNHGWIHIAAELVRSGTPGLALRLGEMNGQGRVGVLHLFEAVRFRSADSRLASFLLERANDDGFVVGLTHQDIADRIMTERKTITVALGRMRRAGLIGIKRKEIVLLQQDALQAIASGRRELREWPGRSIGEAPIDIAVAAAERILRSRLGGVRKLR
jgi:hypothetical protein